jgi:hypothetical protein
MRFAGVAGIPARLLLACAPLLAAAGVQAAEKGFALSAGVAHSDNIGRTSVDEQSETVASAGLDFLLEQRTSRLSLDATGDLQYLNYLDNTYDNEVVGEVMADARFQLVPDRLMWIAQDNFGQTSIDPLAAVTPANRENVNYFSTGPDASLGLASNTRLLLSGRYGKVSYEDSPFDSDRYTGLVGVARDLSAQSRVSLNAQRERVDFDDDVLNQDYNRDQFYARFEGQGGRTRLGLDLGYSRLQRVGDSPSGVLARLEIARQVSVSSVVTISGGREFSDSGDSFRLDQTLNTSLNTLSGEQTGSPFRNTYETIAWRFQRNRTGLSLSLQRYDEKFVQSSLFDRVRTSVSGQFSRNLSPTLTADLGGSYSKEDYDAFDGDYRESGAYVGFTQRFGRMLSLNVHYEWYKRSSDLPTGAYTENRALLTLSYGDVTQQRSPITLDQRLPSDVRL